VTAGVLSIDPAAGYLQRTGVHDQFPREPSP
jgi:hypothetical protein